jgi:hypothetical protein
MLIVTQENRIEPSQLPASVRCRELPVDLVGGSISFGLPGADFGAQLQGVVDAAVQMCWFNGNWNFGRRGLASRTARPALGDAASCRGIFRFAANPEGWEEAGSPS